MIAYASGNNRSILELDRVECIQAKSIAFRNSEEACDVISHWKKSITVNKRKVRTRPSHYHGRDLCEETNVLMTLIQ